jgi:hypothetical protein
MKNLAYNAYHIISIIVLLLVFIIGLVLTLAIQPIGVEEQPLVLLLLTKVLGLALLVLSYNRLLKYNIIQILSK